MSLTDRTFSKNSISMGYKLFLPDDHEEQEDASYPLILFLHGIKKRGDDLNLLNDYGLLRIVEQDRNFPYIVVVPQCPAHSFWPDNRTTVMELLKDVVCQYRVDQRSIYITGFSMGGNGVWDYVANTKGLFAAAIPIAGWYETSLAERLTDTPIWAFHGEKDETVPISGSESMINSILELGGSPRFTRYPGMDHKHEVMYMTYTNPELYDWLNNNKNE